MMGVIGLSGAQGAGKSTLLAELKTRGYYVDTFKVSRAVQKQLNWNSLSCVMDSPRSMIEFQEEVFNQKYQNDFKLKSDTESITLTERTFADIVAYSNLWAFKFVDEGRMSLLEAFDFLRPLTKKCSIAQQEIYQSTLLLPLMSHISWEDDSNRANRGDAERVYEDITRFIESTMPVSFKTFTITGKTAEERVDQVIEFLKR